MEPRQRLLDHPFYRAWTKGEITRDQLGAYHRSYAEFIRQVPVYWERVVLAFDEQAPGGREIVAEERSHIALWEEWGEDFPATGTAPGMSDVCREFDRLTPSQLLGALHAFEVQQPEVARTKRDGLLRFYGFRGEQLRYFDEHENEAKHIAFGSRMAETFADRKEFEAGFARGAEVVYHSLDRFVVC